MSETRMEQKIDLEALEATVLERSASGHGDTVRDEIIRLLIVENRALRVLTTPEPIGEKHKRGDTWLCYFPASYGWSRVYWSERLQHWQSPDGAYLLGTPPHALPIPGEVKP